MVLLARCLFVFIIGFCTSTHAAMSCFVSSQAYSAQQDEYWQINPINSAPTAEKKRFLAQAERFSGRITGTHLRDECTGRENKPSITTSKSSFKGTLEVQGDSVKLVLEVTNNKDKTIKQERMEFLGRSPTVQFSSGTDGGFTFAQKLRANAKLGDKISLLRESQYTVSFNNEQFIIQATHFANGLSYAQDYWVITPR